MTVGAIGFGLMLAIFLVPVSVTLAATLWLIFRRKEQVEAMLVDGEGEIPVLAWRYDDTPWWRR